MSGKMTSPIGEGGLNCRHPNRKDMTDSTKFRQNASSLVTIVERPNHILEKFPTTMEK